MRPAEKAVEDVELDPQARAFLDRLAAAGRPAISTLAPEDARAANAALTRVCAGPELALRDVYDREIPGPRGPIGARVYVPVGLADGPAPALVYYHGGGFVIGDLAMVDDACRLLADRSACIVISVDYRLAPEFPYPAPRDDAYAAFAHVVREAAAFGVDPARVAVGGDSAGGTLATIVALLARDRGEPQPAFQLLVYPGSDRDMTRPSMIAFGEGYLLTLEMMRWFHRQHCAEPALVPDPYLAPLDATDLRGLPPALVLTAGYDPLRDGGELYAERMRAAGVPVESVRYGRMIHGFFAYPYVFDAAYEAIERCALALARALGVAAEGGSRPVG
jgi:acetyl esterase